MKYKYMPLLAALLTVGAVFATDVHQPKAQAANQDSLSTENILHDPSLPTLGNPKGDITIVEYFDYRCPYCKKVNPVLQKIVKEDGHIRLVFKDWPVFGDVSVFAARLALAAKYQNKYPEAHEALISSPDKLTEANVRAQLAQAGVDVERAQSDLAAHSKEIDALLARNHEQALALEFQGTPAFIIGKFRVPGVLDEANFKQAIADSRAAVKKKFLHQEQPPAAPAELLIARRIEGARGNLRRIIFMKKVIFAGAMSAGLLLWTGIVVAQTAFEITPQQERTVYTNIYGQRVVSETTPEYDITVGAVVPSNVELLEVPATVGYAPVQQYRYVTVGSRVVLVEPATRKVVRVIAPPSELARDKAMKQ
jgi:protein-disulfide isomerase